MWPQLHVLLDTNPPVKYVELEHQLDLGEVEGVWMITP